MIVPEGFLRRVTPEGTALLRSDLGGAPLAEWWRSGEPMAEVAGRGSVARATIGGIEVVLRDYRRGGAFRHVLPDLFSSPRRAFRELLVAAELRRRGVGVAEPVAALARKRTLGFELRIATVFLRTASALPRFIAEHPALRAAAVRAAGAVVGRAFAAGLHHRDLHPDNLLARSRDDGTVEVVLIDLDRARLVDDLDGSTRDAMLVRMARYLHRHARDLPVQPSATDHLRFLGGLGLRRDERRAAWAVLDPKLRRALARRGLALREPD